MRFADRQRAERGRLDQRAVNLVRLGVQRLPEQQPAQAHVHQDRAVAVVPVERQQPVLAGLLLRGERAERLEFLVRRPAVALRDEVVDEPEEDVADGRLPGLDAVESGQDRAVHDPADAGDVGELLRVGHDHHVAGARAEDFHERALADAGADRAHVRVERAGGDRDARLQPELLRPFRREPPRQRGRPAPPSRRAARAARPAPDRAPRRNSLSGSPPHSSQYIALWPAAQTPRTIFSGRVSPASSAGIQSQCSTKLCAAANTFGAARLQRSALLQNHSEEYVPPHLARYCGRDFPRAVGDLRRLGVAGVVLPEPGHRIEVPLELRQHRQRRAVAVHRHRRAAGGVNPDADDLRRGRTGGPPSSRGRIVRGATLERGDVVLRILPRQVRLARVEQDPRRARRKIEHAACHLAPVAEVHDQAAAGVRPVVESQAHISSSPAPTNILPSSADSTVALLSPSRRFLQGLRRN